MRAVAEKLTVKDILQALPTLKLKFLPLLPHSPSICDVPSSSSLRFPQVLWSTPLSGVTYDSRNVLPNYVFVDLTNPALEQVSKTGTYIADAISKGAAAVVVEENQFDKLEKSAGVIYITSPNCHEILSDLSRLFYPSHPKWLIGVTGTNGKTSTVSFIRQILGHLGRKVASLGTLGLQIENVPEFNRESIPIETHNTSMYAPVFHRCLHRLADEFAVDCVAFEASSHGLREYRAHGVRDRVQIAVFTNFTQDHLDYHPDMADYFASKCRLFSDLLIVGGVGIVFLSNRLAPDQIQTVRDICAKKSATVWIYGENYGDLYFRLEKTSASSSSVVFNLWGTEVTVSGSKLQMFPAFQTENLLVALGVVKSLLQLPIPELAKLATQVPGFIQCVSGRMEFVGATPSGGKVFVDFAHSPDALEIVLRESWRRTRPSEKVDPNPNDDDMDNNAKLVVVFGCGGNRDSGKRPEMGRIAATYSTHVIVTDDNPRHEDPGQIRKQILQGVHEYLAGKQKCVEVHEINDRKAAIQFAISCLQSEADICILAGKGAESYQQIGNVYHKFNDKEVALDLLHELSTNK